MSLEIPTDRVAQVLKTIRDLTKTQLLIGIPAEGAERQPEPGEPNPPNNAAIGYLNEFGDPEQNIPPRPHLLPGVESIIPKAIPRLKKAGAAALNGDKGAVEREFMAIGLMGADAVRKTITDGGFVKLAPRTLAARRARGRTGEAPLIDTGQLRRAYTYVIRVRGR